MFFNCPRQSCSSLYCLFLVLSPSCIVALIAPPGGKMHIMTTTRLLADCSGSGNTFSGVVAYRVRVRLLQPLMSRVKALEGALDIGFCLCSTPQRLRHLQSVAHFAQLHSDIFANAGHCHNTSSVIPA